MTDDRDGAAEPPAESASARDLCARCGDAIDTSEWHPVLARSEPDEFRVYPFCDETCRDDWDDVDDRDET